MRWNYIYSKTRGAMRFGKGLKNMQTESDVAQFIREELRGRHVKRGYPAKRTRCLMGKNQAWK